jgi:uncharacterized protein YndB with AHSA1/START domain
MLRRVRRSVELLVPPAEVWRHLTDPRLLSRWWEGRAELDPRPRGAVRVEGPEGFWDGYLEDVEPERRLVWEWSSGGLAWSRVVVTLEPTEGGGTRLSVVEEALDDLGGSGGTQTALAISGRREK